VSRVTGRYVSGAADPRTRGVLQNHALSPILGLPWWQRRFDGGESCNPCHTWTHRRYPLCAAHQAWHQGTTPRKACAQSTRYDSRIGSSETCLSGSPLW